MARFILLATAVSALFTVAASGHDDSVGSVPDNHAHLSFSVGNAGETFGTISLRREPPANHQLHDSLEQAMGCVFRDRESDSNEHWWWYQGGCDSAFQRRPLQVAGRIELSAIKDALTALHVETVSINVSHPGAELSTPGLELGDVTSEWGYTTHSLEEAALTDIPDSLELEFGLSQGHLARSGLVTASILFLPAILVAWWTRRALTRLDTSDGRLWFRYQFQLLAILLGAWVAWWASVAYFGLDNLPAFLLQVDPYHNPAMHFLRNFIWLVVPAVGSVLAMGASQPFSRIVAGNEWTLKETLAQHALAFGMIVVPGTCVLTACQLLLWPDYRQAVLWLVAGVITFVLLQGPMKRSAGFQPQLLTTGELRDRVFELAQNASVKIRQLHIVPTAKGRMANAFAVGSKDVMLSQLLVEKLTKRELDSVVGHELAHLKGRHGWWILLAVPLCLAVAIVIAEKLEIGIDHVPVWAYGGLVIAATIIAWTAVSRRCERRADAQAVDLTGDPEAFITGQKKLAALNLLPMDWSEGMELVLTHPSSRRRIEAAAKQASISPERLEEILRAPEPEDADRYELPPLGEAGQHVFTAETRTGIAVRKFASDLIALAVPPLIGVSLALRWDLAPLATALVGFAALATTMAAMILLDKWEPFLGLGKLVHLVKQNRIRSGFPESASNAVVVGLCPGDRIRFFEYLPFWDVGQLCANGERLIYAGDHTSFAIERSHLTRIEWKTTMPFWWPDTRAIVRWRNPDTGREGAFHVSLLKQRTLGELFRPPVELERVLETWQRGEANEFEVKDFDSAGAPEFGEITCLTPCEFACAKNYAVLILQTAVVALVIGFLFDLPFQTTLSAAGAGWWLVLLATSARAIVVAREFLSLRRAD